MARPRSVIDWKLLDQLCGIQCTQEEIAAALDLSADTIARAIKREHGITFPEYFATKRLKGRVSLRRRQFQKAMQGDTTMLIWLDKQHLGGSDKSEVRGAGVLVVPGAITAEQWSVAAVQQQAALSQQKTDIAVKHGVGG